MKLLQVNYITYSYSFIHSEQGFMPAWQTNLIYIMHKRYQNHFKGTRCLGSVELVFEKRSKPFEHYKMHG